MPAATSSESRSAEEVAGPNVQTILARRMVKPYGLPARSTEPATPLGRPVPTGGHAHAVSGRSVGLIGLGRAEEPVRNASTPCAAARPSAMAQTISDCPRPASPATKTPGTEVWKSLPRLMFER